MVSRQRSKGQPPATGSNRLTQIPGFIIRQFPSIRNQETSAPSKPGPMGGERYCHSPPSWPAPVVTSDDPNSWIYGIADPVPPYWSLKGGYRATVGPSPPIGTAAVATVPFGFFSDAISGEEPRHFLDSCFRCKNPLAGNRDIFMYSIPKDSLTGSWIGSRGDTPFCSVECRQEQIEVDEAEERKTALKHQISMKHEDQQRRSSPSKSPKIRVNAAGTVAAR